VYGTGVSSFATRNRYLPRKTLPGEGVETLAPIRRGSRPYDHAAWGAFVPAVQLLGQSKLIVSEVGRVPLHRFPRGDLTESVNRAQEGWFSPIP